MEQQNQLTPVQAFQVIFEATGTLQLNRKDSQVLDASLRTLASLLPKEEAPEAEPEVSEPIKIKK